MRHINKSLTNIFNFMNYNVRVVVTEGEPWFVAQDVCQCLGLDHTATAVRGIPALDKKVLTKAIVSNSHISVSNRGVTAINEGGLYRLIMRSTRAEARKFQDWGTQVVLPSIRKDGAYFLGEEKVVD